VQCFTQTKKMLNELFACSIQYWTLLAEMRTGRTGDKDPRVHTRLQVNVDVDVATQIITLTLTLTLT